MTCQSYITSLPLQRLLPASVPISDQMLTIWPLEKPNPDQLLNDDCASAVDHYDLVAADAAITDAQRQGANFDGRGPFLIGWAPSNTRGIPDKVVLVVDMSGLESQDSFDKAFQFWKERIVDAPDLWKDGFKYEGMKLAFRDLVDQYGQDIIDAIKFSNPSQ